MLVCALQCDPQKDLVIRSASEENAWQNHSHFSIYSIYRILWRYQVGR